MLKHTLIILSIFFALCSCATSEKYNQKLNQDLGKSYTELTNEYGNPSSIKRLKNGDMIVSYVNINTELLPDPNYFFDNNDFLTEDEMFYPFTYGGNEIPIGNFMGEEITNYCETKFYLKNNLVTSWSWKGNSCVAI
jgi:hypothetical protein